jgi:hypothetical protein
VVFPELFRGIFSGDAGEDLLATCASFHRQLLRPRTIGVKSGGDKYLDAHPGRSSDHRHPHRRRRIDHSAYCVLRRPRLRMFSSLCRFCRLCVALSIQSIAKAQNKEIYDIVKIGRKEGKKEGKKEGSAPGYNKVSVSRSHSLSHVLRSFQPRIILCASAGSRNFSILCHVCANWGMLIGGGHFHVNFAASSHAKL